MTMSTLPRRASATRDFLAFPEEVRDDMGNALGIVQFGGTPPSAKPWKGLGPGVSELVESHDGNAYRTISDMRRERLEKAIDRHLGKPIFTA